MGELYIDDECEGDGQSHWGTGVERARVVVGGRGKGGKLEEG